MHGGKGIKPFGLIDGFSEQGALKHDKCYAPLLDIGSFFKTKFMQDYFFIHLKNRFVRVGFHEIRYVLSVDHHIKIFTDDGMLMPHLHLKELEAILPETEFIRVNRGTLIPLRRVLSFDKENVFIKDAVFSFGDKFKRQFDEKVIAIVHRES